jgi:hypothetical protein
MLFLISTFNWAITNKGRLTLVGPTFKSNTNKPKIKFTAFSLARKNLCREGR